MKTFLYFYIIFACQLLICQEVVTKKINNKKVQVSEHYENGNLKEKGIKKLSTKYFKRPESNLHCGITSFYKHGKWKHYYPNGSLKSVIVYRKGEIAKIKKEKHRTNDKDSVKVFFYRTINLDSADIICQGISSNNPRIINYSKLQSLTSLNTFKPSLQFISLRQALEITYNKSSFFIHGYLSFRLVINDEKGLCNWIITATRTKKTSSKGLKIKTKEITINSIGEVVSFQKGKWERKIIDY